MATGGHPTSGQAAIKKARRERKYGAQRIARTEANRKLKWQKHIKLHPNYIQGIEKMKKSLGIA